MIKIEMSLLSIVKFDLVDTLLLVKWFICNTINVIQTRYYLHWDNKLAKGPQPYLLQLKKFLEEKLSA